MRDRRIVLGVVAAALLCAGAAAGCGDDDKSTATVVQDSTGAVVPSTVPTTTTQTPTAKENPVTVGTTPTATTGEPIGGGKPTGAGTTTTAPDTGGTPAGGEEGQGGAGDEEAVRTPVALTTDGGALSPTTVTIPAFLALQITVTAQGAAEKVTIAAPGGGTLDVPAGGKASKTLSGLKPGDYAVTTAGGGKTVLHVVNGGDPGP